MTLIERARLFVVKHPYWVLFMVAFVARVLFFAATGFNHHIPDSPKYLGLVDSILAGNQSMEMNNGLYLTAPLYPYFLVLVRLLVGPNYIYTAVFLQILLHSVSVIYLFRLTQIIVPQWKGAAWMTAAVYSFLPSILFFCVKIAQECFFQSFLIGAAFYLAVGIKESSLKKTAISAVLFSLAFLSKSHIMLFAPAIVVVIFLSRQWSVRSKTVASGMYAAICFLFTVPNGLNTYFNNGVYTLSSTGPGMFFYYGNTETQYRFVVETPPRGTEAYQRLHSLDFSYANGPSYDTLMSIPLREREKHYYHYAFQWIRNNPVKWVRLKLVSAKLFLTPTVSFRHYPFGTWLLSFVTLAPLYLLGYIGIIAGMRNNWRKHIWMVLMVLFMLVFSMLFGTNRRFTTVTMEQFMLIYASYGYFVLAQSVNKWGKKKLLPV